MAMKKDKTLIIVCSVVGSLGLLSAIMGFSAEGTKLTPYTILVYGDDCLYPQNPAIGLGICAAIFLVVAQVTISAVGGCCGCCRSRSIPSETKKIVGIVCAVFSWIAAVIAFALFIEGASWNANVWRLGVAPFCPSLKDGVFAGAGVLTLAATALGITSFIMLRTQPAPAPASQPPVSAAATPSGQGGQSPSVVIGQPLLPLSGKPQDQPLKPQEYGQPHQVPATEHHPQAGYAYAQAPQNTQPPPPAAHGNGYHAAAANQHLPPRPAPAPAAAAPAVAVAACAPAAALGVAVGQPLQQVGMDIPAGHFPSTAPPATGNNGSGLGTVIRNEVARQGIRMAAEVVRHSLFSNNTAGDNDGVSMMPDSTGGDVVQVTN